tara:strand:- start:850 stop:1290 length:441 start_codon:yes stop_codon:yes gene_type:complete
MKIISHRGNIEGPVASTENHPDQIKKVLKMGFDVEIDVRYIDGKYVLGHDTPDYQVSKDFLLNDKLWCHAKNIDGLLMMSTSNIHCFWHQQDDVTLTSLGYLWTYPGNMLTPYSICVMPETVDSYKSFNCYGLCTDLPIFYKEMLM